MNYTFLFPGQGAQYIGMAKDLYKDYQVVKDLFSLCADVTRKDIEGLLFDGDEETFKNTENTQIAMTLTNIACAYALKERGVVPARVAGFSLGEYASLVLAGVLELRDVFDMVVVRGKIMDETGAELEKRYSQEGTVGKTAVLGLSPDFVKARLEEWKIENVYVSMYNSPVQAVIGGTERARNLAGEKLVDLGAKRLVPLKVSGPFHTPLMQPASDKFAEAIAGIEFKNPDIPLYSNVTGAKATTGAEIKTLCVQQLVKPVQWVVEEDTIWKDACGDAAGDVSSAYVLEVGIGTVLNGLWKAWKKEKNDEAIPNCISIGTSEALEKLEV